MAKKVNLSDLEKDEKKKLGKVSFVTIFSVFIACVIMVGCFACAQSPGGKPSKEQQAQMDKIYWSSAVDGTQWTVTVKDDNKGILEGQKSTLGLKFKLEEDGSIAAYFSEGDTTVLSGKLNLVSNTGSIDFEDEEEIKKWDVKFSEKNNVRYLTISCGNGNVYYTSK